MPLWHNQQQAHDVALVPCADFDLPDQETTEEYFSIFCHTAVRYIFPIVDPHLFRRTITVAYEPLGKVPSMEQAKAKACVLSFLSIVSRLEPARSGPPPDSDAWALKAQYMLPQILLIPSVEVLQIALMQVSTKYIPSRWVKLRPSLH